jgi:hypothetical protein
MGIITLRDLAFGKNLLSKRKDVRPPQEGAYSSPTTASPLKK